MLYLIAVRIDSKERLENLELTIKHLQSSGDKVFVAEFDTQRQIFIDGLLYMFEKDDNEIFHRTKHFNTMLSKIDSEIIALCDSDVIIPHSQLKKAKEKILSGELDMVYPYSNSAFVMTEPLFKKKLKETGNLDFIKGHGWEHTQYMKPAKGSSSTGGCCILRRSSWIEAGGENERCVGWGGEDWERRDRMPILGYKQGRIEGFLYHLYHPRGINSSEQNPVYAETMDEWRKVAKMSDNELRRYIEGWEWKSRL